jgi:hypothetical protein
MPVKGRQHRADDAAEISELQRRNIEWARQQNEDIVRAQPGLAELRARMLALGGEEVMFDDFEPYLHILLERGTSFGSRSRVKRGIAHRCYHNAAELWRTSEGQLQIAIGYALWGAFWSRHSWAIALQQKPPVIETTRKRESYYGAVLTDAEAEQFYADEHIPDRIAT